MSIDKNTNEGKNYRNNVVKSTPGTSKSRINTGFPENISVLSPMMREYCKTKESYKDCILFYRLGDFYEMFFDDAILVSKELELTLTGKDCGLEERTSMGREGLGMGSALSSRTPAASRACLMLCMILTVPVP